MWDEMDKTPAEETVKTESKQSQVRDTYTSLLKTVS